MPTPASATPAPTAPTSEPGSSASAKPTPAPAKKTAAELLGDEPPKKKWAKPGDLPPDGVKPPGEDLPQPPPWWKTLRAEPPAYIRFLLGAGFIAFLMFLWWLVTRGPALERSISPNLLPSPGEVFGSFTGEAGNPRDPGLLDRELGKSTVETLTRVLKGILAATVVGVGLGILAGAHRGVNSALLPLVIFLRSVPMGALVPLTLILFGFEEPQKAKFIFLAVVPFVFSDTLKAIATVPERYVETAQTLGASYFQIVRKVLVPLALPDIVTSLRFQFGLALGYIMLVEEINTEYGLGKLIFGSQQKGLPQHLWLLLFVIALIAFTIDLVLRTLQRGVFPWRRDL